MKQFFLFLPAVAWIATLIGTALVLKLLTRAQVMDQPNERSNHKAPTPRGGGIAMIAVTLISFAIIGIPWPILAAGLVLGAVSFIDDIRGLSVRERFFAQFVAVALGFLVIPALIALHGKLLPTFIPGRIEYVLIAIAWLWFINLTNFMDGIDGISALQTIAMMTGIILIYSFYDSIPLWLVICAAVLAASALGFLRFNISPARLFMGDVGSIPLGYLNFFLLLSLAFYGQKAAALILPAYYLTDATWTLLKRGFRGEKVWQAHSQHAYQKAVRGGLSHNAVVARISALNALLVALALVPTPTMMAGIVTCATAYALAFIFVYYLSHAPVQR